MYLDEVNLADMEFMREVTHRCKYMMTTSNPDDPSLDIYKEFINKSRPIPKYEKDYPTELLKELKEPHVKGWVHWYFTFYDNAALTKEDIQEKIDATPIGTKMYKNKIQGLRGKATGLCFNLQPKNIITVEEAKKNGVDLVYVNTRDIADVNKELRKYSEKGFDDVFIFAPNEEMVTYGVKMLAFDGCLNFFSGPADQEFSSRVNFYNIHYNSTHFVGTSGGNTEDMKQSIELIESKTVNVAKIATHILGLDHAVETTKALPELEGSKKIVYTHKKFPLTEVDKFDENSDDEYIRELKSIVERNGNLWSAEAERYFIQNAPEI